MSLQIDEIKAIFHFSTEHKETEKDQREKNNRRFETICRRLPEIMHIVHKSNKSIIVAIKIMSQICSFHLNVEDILSAIRELESFYKIISNNRIDIGTKAAVIRNFDFREYRKLANICKLKNLKSISRLVNMRSMAINYLHDKFDKKLYAEDLKLQSLFFHDLISKYKNITNKNFYVLVLRYDLKTLKKKGNFHCS